MEKPEGFLRDTSLRRAFLVLLCRVTKKYEKTVPPSPLRPGVPPGHLPPRGGKHIVDSSKPRRRNAAPQNDRFFVGQALLRMTRFVDFRKPKASANPKGRIVS